MEDGIENGPCELPFAAHPWMAYAGFIETGDANSSQSVDDIVYDSDRQRGVVPRCLSALAQTVAPIPSPFAIRGEILRRSETYNFAALMRRLKLPSKFEFEGKAAGFGRIALHSATASTFSNSATTSTVTAVSSPSKATRWPSRESLGKSGAT